MMITIHTNNQKQNHRLPSKHRKTRKLNSMFRRFLALFLAIVTLISTIGMLDRTQPESEVYAVTRLKLSAAKAVAVANSSRIEALDLQIDSKQAAKESAIRSLREKERNMSTFRWSPLLSFKFPTNPNEAEAFEFAYKPVQLQYDIDTLEHKITDAKLDEYEKVSTIYVDIISSTAEISFLQSRISNMEIALAKNKGRLIEGVATQAQIDLQEEKLESMKSDLATEKTNLERAKEKLGKELGFSVTSGYTFEESFQSMSIDRNNLDYLEAYALERDQTVFEAKQNMELARLALVTNYNLMKNHYGGNIGMISGYVQQSLDGSSIDKRSFKKDYDAFLKKIDEPWTGSKRILFFKFPKEWFKGDNDGIRYVEDDPYVLYSATLDYESAVKEYNNACDELRSQVEDGYDAYIEARKAYLDAQKDLEKQKNEMINGEALNALGQMSLEEYDTIRSEYEASRSELKDALATYTTTLYEYDHTTCGGASAYFTEESLSTQTGAAGLGTPEITEGDIEDDLNNLDAVVRKGATYSIRSIVDTQEFMLYISIPDDFEYNVRQFELWSDGRRIGDRVAVDESIRHLTLTIEDVDSVYVRLYDDQYSTDEDNFIDDCAIDPTVSYGPLNITVGYQTIDAEREQVIGSYTLEDDENTDMIKLRFTFDQNAVHRSYQMGADVAYYNMAAEQNLYLFSNDLTPSEDAFTYMSFIKSDIGKLTLRMFSEDGTYIGGAKLNTNTGKLYVDEDVTEADMQEIAARQILVTQKTASLQTELTRLKDLLAAAQNVNGQEADSATITYYKDRIAELEMQIEGIEDAITEEEIQTVLQTRSAEIARMVEAMTIDDETGEAADAMTLSAEERAARTTILNDAARTFLQNQRSEEKRQALQTALSESEWNLLKLKREYEKAERDGDKALMEQLSIQIEAASKEVSVNQEKLALAARDDSDISDEDISEALLIYGDQIYASVTDRLSDAMLYGSETGQWAIAYLEAHDMEVTPQNIRDVVSMASYFPTYEAMLARQDALEEELQKARETARQLREKGGTENLACAEQLDTVAAAYEREIAQLKKNIKKTDPGREVALRDLRARLQELKAEREKLISVVTPKLEDYTSAEKAALNQARAAYNSLSYSRTMVEASTSRYNDKIQEYQNQIAMLDASHTSELDQAETNIANYRKYVADHSANADDYYQKASRLPETGVAGIIRRIYMNQYEQAKSSADYYQRLADNLEAEYGEILEARKTQAGRQAYTERMNQKIREEEAARDGMMESHAAAMAAAAVKRDEAQTAYDKKCQEWQEAYARQQDIDAQIKAIENEIADYY